MFTESGRAMAMVPAMDTDMAMAMVTGMGMVTGARKTTVSIIPTKYP